MPCIVAMAIGPIATPVRGIDIAADQDQVGVLARGQQLRDRQAVGDDLDGPARQRAGDFQRGRAAVQEDRIAVVEQCGGRAADRALLGGLGGRPVVEGRHRPDLPRVDGAAVRALDRTGEVERLQVASDGALGHPERPDQLVEGGKPLPGDQVEELLPARLGEHWRPLNGFRRTIDLDCSRSVMACQGKTEEFGGICAILTISSQTLATECRPVYAGTRSRDHHSGPEILRAAMPELPEVETMVRGLRPALEGVRIRAPAPSSTRRCSTASTPKGCRVGGRARSSRRSAVEGSGSRSRSGESGGSSSSSPG